MKKDKEVKKGIRDVLVGKIEKLELDIAEVNKSIKQGRENIKTISERIEQQLQIITSMKGGVIELQKLLKELPSEEK